MGAALSCSPGAAAGAVPLPLQARHIASTPCSHRALQRRAMGAGNLAAALGQHQPLAARQPRPAGRAPGGASCGRAAGARHRCLCSQRRPAGLLRPDGRVLGTGARGAPQFRRGGAAPEVRNWAGGRSACGCWRASALRGWSKEACAFIDHHTPAPSRMLLQGPVGAGAHGLRGPCHSCAATVQPVTAWHDCQLMNRTAPLGSISRVFSHGMGMNARWAFPFHTSQCSCKQHVACMYVVFPRSRYHFYHQTRSRLLC